MIYKDNRIDNFAEPMEVLMFLIGRIKNLPVQFYIKEKKLDILGFFLIDGIIEDFKVVNLDVVERMKIWLITTKY